MLAICIESSHQRGMGHFYRMVNLVQVLKAQGKKYIVFLNQDEASERILRQERIPFEVVDLWDTDSNWEVEMIQKYKIHHWLNDRMGTRLETARHIKSAGVCLCAIDDTGDGAQLTDKNFCPGCFEEGHLPDGKVFRGLEYLVLNPQISEYQYQRIKMQRIIVTLGGSDTYGVTLLIVGFLKNAGIAADVVVGPSFRQKEALDALCRERFQVKQGIPSLVEEFRSYDLAVTGGGVTPFEACASGLPCVIVANELHEIATGKLLESLGCASFIGYYKNLSYSKLMDHIRYAIKNIKTMSSVGIEHIPLNGAENLLREVFA